MVRPTSSPLERLRARLRKLGAALAPPADDGRAGPAPTVEESARALALFAGPERMPAAPRPAGLDARPPASPPPPAPGPRAGDGLLTVCTRSHLHFARTLLESWRRHQPGAPAFVVVADAEPGEPIALEGATVLAGRQLAPRQFPYLALKYGPTDLCCALKPFGVRWLLERTSLARVVYADADLCFFAPPAALLAGLEEARFVVTPHVLAPLPNPQRFWERPTLGDLAYAGPLNAGLFGVRADAESLRFVELWGEMVVAPGAFLPGLGGQMEQNSFNWVTCFADGVRILRDPAYNVAYWNLHDRSVRCTSLDQDGAEPSWTVDGRPLVAFHFSGYSPDQPSRLSKHDHRHSLYLLPSVALLCEQYASRLAAHGGAQQAAVGYRYAAFPSGIPIDDRMRRLFKEHELALRSELDPWTAEGEAHYCRALLSVVPAAGSFLPLLFEDVYAARPDLQQAYPRARSRPEELLAWIGQHGIYEHRYEALFDRHRPADVHGEAIPALARLLASHPELFAGLRAPLRAERQETIGRLERAGLAHAAELIRAGAFERYRISVLWMVRRAWEERADVRRAYPAPLSADGPAFTTWLRDFGVADCRLPERAADLFAARAEGRSLARLFSYLSRDWAFMESWPLGLVGVGADELALRLLANSSHGLEYDLEDLVHFLWLMEREPWQGLPLTLELPINARRHPSPLLPEGQQELLRPLLENEPRFRRALVDYRERFSSDLHRRQEEEARRLDLRRPDREVSVFRAIDRQVARRLAGSPAPAAEPAGLPAGSAAGEPAGLPAGGRSTLVHGVNLFGYHRSPIGLGSLTRGLAAALDAAEIPSRALTLGNVAMSGDLRPEDFLRAWEPRFDTNLFVSYPHVHELLLEAQPEHVVRNRRNVAYLAWEQRDGGPYWPEALRGFGQVWALSKFAAGALERCLGRTVHALPPVLELDGLPPAATKAAVGLDPDRFVFLYVFDANSSIERKNPEAAVAAFARAFTPADPACLVLRVSNAHRPEHRERLERLVRSAPAGTRLELRLEPLSRTGVLQLLSAADCYVSLHRAEGFGYTCAEAMAYGRPVVASAYSGNLDFMTPENSFLVRCGECTVTVPDGPFQRGSVWGDPSVEHAAQRMREVFEDRAGAAAVGRRAAAEVRVGLSAAVVGERVRALLGYGGRSSGELPIAARTGS